MIGVFSIDETDRERVILQCLEASVLTVHRSREEHASVLGGIMINNAETKRGGYLGARMYSYLQDRDQGRDILQCLEVLARY